MLVFTLFPLISFLTLVSAGATCDASSALTPEQLASLLKGGDGGSTGGGSSSGSSGGGSGVCLFPDCPYCGSDPTGQMCLSWHRTQLQGGINAGMANGAGLFGTFGKLRKRAELLSPLLPRATLLECSENDICLVVSKVYLCLDATTLDFKDSNGGSGNADSDIYTMVNGAVTSVASTATAWPTPNGGSGSKSTALGAQLTSTGTATVSGAKATGSGGTVQLVSAAGSVMANGAPGMALVMAAAIGAVL